MAVQAAPANPPAKPMMPQQKPAAVASAQQQQAPDQRHGAPRTQHIIETVHVPYAYGHYGRVHDNSPNRLYKKYLAWFMEKYGTSKRPLNFRQWIRWAKRRGIVPGYSADGGEEAEKAVNNAGRNMLIVLGVLAAIGIVLNFMEEKK